ncbi:MAG: hypothetical protein RL062_1425 [Bacteroidota bacterium]
MNRSIAFFLIIAGLLVWTNEWCKINVNYQLYVRSKIQNFDSLPLAEKISVKEQHEEYAPYSFFHSHSDFSWFYQQDLEFWKTLKWGVPILFTMFFAILEWWFLPSCFPAEEISRRYILVYYLGLSLLVVVLYACSLAWPFLPLQNVGRKIWMILQSPSFFVLLLINQWKRKYEYQ